MRTWGFGLFLVAGLPAAACPAALAGAAPRAGAAAHAGAAPLAGTAPRAGAAAKWRVQPTPDPAGAKASTVLAVSCPAGNMCAAVGGYIGPKGGPELALAEAWQGKAWSVQATPDPPKALQSYLSGISCISGVTCEAVGTYESVTGAHRNLVEAWNGKIWAIRSAPDPAGAVASELSGLACTSAVSCVAVGWYERAGGAEVTLVESWNGKRWQVVASPNRAGARISALASVACMSATSCLAVGEYVSSSGVSSTLGEVWKGAGWALDYPRDPTGRKGSSLNGVSCEPTGTCIAVGSYDGDQKPLGEAWTKGSWVVKAPPPPPGATSSSLGAVSCTAGGCSAVGGYLNAGGAELTLAAAWNGKTWTVTPTVDPSAGGPDTLAGVSCVTTTACTGAGVYALATGPTLTLAERYST